MADATYLAEDIQNIRRVSHDYGYDCDYNYDIKEGIARERLRTLQLEKQLQVLQQAFADVIALQAPSFVLNTTSLVPHKALHDLEDRITKLERNQANLVSEVRKSAHYQAKFNDDVTVGMKQTSDRVTNLVDKFSVDAMRLENHINTLGAHW